MAVQHSVASKGFARTRWERAKALYGNLAQNPPQAKINTALLLSPEQCQGPKSCHCGSDRKLSASAMAWSMISTTMSRFRLRTGWRIWSVLLFQASHCPGRVMSDFTKMLCGTSSTFSCLRFRRTMSKLWTATFSSWGICPISPWSAENQSGMYCCWVVSRGRIRRIGEPTWYPIDGGRPILDW